jgi:hypothetical protein
LPSLIATLQGAEKVQKLKISFNSKIVITDYPDAELQENVVYNVKQNIPVELQSRIHVQVILFHHPINILGPFMGQRRRIASLITRSF